MDLAGSFEETDLIPFGCSESGDVEQFEVNCGVLGALHWLIGFGWRKLEASTPLQPVKWTVRMPKWTVWTVKRVKDET